MGPLNTKKVCDMVDAHYGVVAPHNAQGPVSAAMCVQVVACSPNFLIQEIFDDLIVSWNQTWSPTLSGLSMGTFQSPIGRV